MATPARKTTAGNDQAIIQGLQTKLDPSMSLPINGKTYSPASLAALIQRRIDLCNAIVTTKAQWLATIHEYETLTRLSPLRSDVQQA